MASLEIVKDDSNLVIYARLLKVPMQEPEPQSLLCGFFAMFYTPLV